MALRAVTIVIISVSCLYSTAIFITDADNQETKCRQTPQNELADGCLAHLRGLLVALLSISLQLLMFVNALLNPQVLSLLKAQSSTQLALWVLSLAFVIAMWYYTLWLTMAFFKRRKNVPKHYIIWLLVSLLLALKAFAFAPVSDTIARCANYCCR